MEHQNQRKGPTFVIGTGRCGSTFVQSLISDNSDIWMWGEHDGVLNGIFRWGDSIRNSVPLRQFSFRHQQIPPLERAHLDPTVAAWSVPFASDDIIDIERDIVTRLFASQLPEGYARWGFKEIRYGPESDFVRRMSQLFPDCRIVYLVRDPLRTADSSVRAWHRQELVQFADQPDGQERIRTVFDRYLARWQRVTEYFLAEVPKWPKTLRILRLEDIQRDATELFEFVDAPQTAGSTVNLRTSSRNEVTFSEVERQSYETLSPVLDMLQKPELATQLGY
jgi:hypothetical protein